MADCRSSSNVSDAVLTPDDDEEDVPKDEFSPREYQVELFEAAVKENTIVCLGTGTGKTFIAVMLIKEYDAAIRIPFEEGGKRTFFLVPTVPLVVQQQKAIKCQTDLRVGGYVGDMNVDNWCKERWIKEFIESQVLVMTPDVFKVIIHHGFLELSRVNLLIMDECHRAVKQHTYREVMRCMDVLEPGERPRILGLTASVINSKSSELQVESKIRALEMALGSCVQTVSNQESMAKYGTKPTEVLVEHRTASSPSSVASIQVPVINSIAMTTSQGQELVRRQRSIVNVLRDLGVWCTHLAINVIMEEARRMLEGLNDDIVVREVEVSLEWLAEVRKRCYECMRAVDSADLVEHRLLVLATPKLKRLLEILWEFRPRRGGAGAGGGDTASDATESLCGIIFVKERIVARVLRDWLRELAVKVPRYAYIVPEFIVGHGANLQLGSKEAGMSFKKQCKVLEQFRHQECNLLVATSVVEEGMDVPKCSLVVRFDFPDDFRSYIQSKGRARAQKSLYVMMTSSDDFPTNCGNLRNYLAIEAMLMTKCHERVAPLNSEVVLSFEIDQLLPPYMPVQKDGAPRITLGSAIGLVNRYCMVLPSDMFTHLKPTYEITTVHINDKEMFVCTVYLPMTSPLKEAIRGQPMETKRYAKMAAALETCRRLHIIDEFDSSLLPVKRMQCAIDGYDDVAPDDDVPPGTAKPGSKKRRRTYRKQVCKLFSKARILIPGRYRLHVLTTKLVSLASDLQNWRREQLFNPQDCPVWFGLLLHEDMPSLPRFPIFTRSGDELVSVSRASIVSLSAAECNKLRRFHRLLWDDVLRMKERQLLVFDFNAAASGPVIAPVLTDGDAAVIDWSLVDVVLKGITKRPVPETGYKFESHVFDDAIVVPRYTPLNYKHHTYYLKKIRYDLSVDSEEGKNTFREYLTHVHHLHVTDSTQPLLELFFTEVRLNLLTPRYRNRKGDIFVKKTAMSRRAEMRVPEFCDVHPIPASVWRKAVCLPSILYRLNQLLVMEELRSSIAIETGIGLRTFRGPWPNLDFQSAVSESASISFAPHDEVEFGALLASHGSVDEIRMPRLSRSFEYQPRLDGNPGPSPGLLLEAVTSAKAADGFDLERLEVLGDSFLKFAVTIDLFCGTTSAQEGLLTQTRARIICNRNLHDLGCKMHVGSMVAQEQFVPHRNWLPPGYSIEEGVEDAMMDADFTFWIFQRDAKILEKLTTEQLYKAYQEYEAAKELPDYVPPPHNTTGPVPICATSQLPDKSVADSVEAIIGAYLLVTGPLGALRVMKWMGLKLPHCELDSQHFSSPDRIHRLGFPAPKTPLMRYVDDPDGQLRSEQSPWHGVMCLAEQTLGYTFRDKAFLLQACTHASYYRNRLTDCYQRLEFLGDAVIDYLVTRYLYEGPHKFNPGQLTDLRSSLVNNTFFAALVVRHGLHRCLLHCNPGLFNAISRFVQHQARLGEDESSGSSEGEEDTTLEILDLNAHRDEVKDNPAYWKVLQRFYYHEEECLEPEEVEVPKALGDLFESLMGAVFLDCGMSLDTVWGILYRLFGREIESFSQCVPLPPIRTLLERFPDARFSPAEVLKNEKVKVELTLGDQLFTCVAKSKKLAKTALAKKCLRTMKLPCGSA